MKKNSCNLSKQEESIISNIKENEDVTQAIFVVSKNGKATQLVGKFKPNKFIYGIR